MKRSLRSRTGPPSGHFTRSPLGSSLALLLAAAAGVLLSPLTTPLQAQMIPGKKVVGEAPAFGLDVRNRAFTVQELSCSAPANVLWPGEKASLRLRITNTTGQPLKGPGTLKVYRYNTGGMPGDVWKTVATSLGEVDSIPFTVDLAAGGQEASAEITVEPKLPETFGGYVLVAEIPGHGKLFAASLVRALKAHDARVQFPAASLDISFGSDPAAVASFFRRIGIKAARMELGVFPEKNNPGFEKQWAGLVEKMQVLKENNIAMMLTLSAIGLPQPLDRGRPHLEADGTFRETKADLASLPSTDGDFEKWVYKLSREFGWPKGPVNALELWNEPWEGISISGWGADTPRFRELYTAMAKGVESARKEGAQVLLGGAGSSSNTIDKLFGDGSDEFLKWLDFCSIHYQPLSATPSMMRDFVSRKHPNGPVRVWDTESWIANAEDRIALVIAAMRAMGQDRAMGVYSGNIYEMQNVLVDGKRGSVVQAWSGAAAMAASTQFVGERHFRGLLFQNGLPWVFVFDGQLDEDFRQAALKGSKTVVSKASPDDGTVVIAGDLSTAFNREQTLFRTVYGLSNGEQARALKAQLAALPATATPAEQRALQEKIDAVSPLSDGKLTLSDLGGKARLFDFNGNPVPAKKGKITVPLNGFGYYLRTDGSRGSFEKLLAELRKANIEGYEPVEIVSHDFTAPLDRQPPVRLTLTNILNRPVSGKLSVAFGKDKAIEAAAQQLTLKPHETRTLEVTLDAARLAALPVAADNTYPLEVTFDAGKDGKSPHHEILRCNVIARRTIAVDGKLDDWKDALPQPLAGAGIAASLTEKAWLPFVNFDDSTAPGTATGYVACDEKNFYFAARIADPTPEAGMVRFETRDEEQYYYPKESYYIDPAVTFTKKIAGMAWRAEQEKLEKEPLQSPDGKPLRVVWESVARNFTFELNLPEGEPKQVALYFLSPDTMGRHYLSVEIADVATGKLLARQIVSGFADGKYVLFRVSGKVKVSIVPQNWLKGVLSGVFVDKLAEADAALQDVPVDPRAPKPKEGDPVPAAKALYLKTDETTQGAWRGVYGAEGFELAAPDDQKAGTDKLSASGVLAFAKDAAKEKLTWPEGVRRFSYRKNPDLPAGDRASHDNVQIAFNVIDADKKPWLQSPPGTPPRWATYWDTDYEYALNPVAPEYGGGTEIWRLLTPGMPYKHFYPREPKSKFDGPVKDGALAVRREGSTRIVEAAIPWTEIPEVKKRIDAGQTIKFSFRVNDNAAPSHELGTSRSVSQQNNSAFHNTFQVHWANELEFAVEPTDAAKKP